MTAVAEQMVLMEITVGLCGIFLDCTMRVDIDAAVRQMYARFDSSPIRDFVPLFVEKRARSGIRPSRPEACLSRPLSSRRGATPRLGGAPGTVLRRGV